MEASSAVFTPNIRTALKIEQQEDLMPALQQIEFLNYAQSKLFAKCSKHCLEKWDTDDLSTNEQECIKTCQTKLFSHYESFYAEHLSL